MSLKENIKSVLQDFLSEQEAEGLTGNLMYYFRKKLIKSFTLGFISGAIIIVLILKYFS